VAPAKKKIVAPVETPADDGRNPIADLGRAALSLAEETRTGNIQIAAVEQGLANIAADLKAHEVRADRLEAKLDQLISQTAKPAVDPRADLRQFMEDLLARLDDRAESDDDIEAVFRKLSDIERWIEADQRAEDAAASTISQATKQLAENFSAGLRGIEAQIEALHVSKVRTAQVQDSKQQLAVKLLIDEFNSLMVAWRGAVDTLTTDAATIAGAAQSVARQADTVGDIGTVAERTLSNFNQFKDKIEQQVASSNHAATALGEQVASIEPTVVRTLLKLFEASAIEERSVDDKSRQF